MTAKQLIVLATVAATALAGAAGISAATASAFDPDIHEQITNEALPFLRPGVLDDVRDEHNDFADDSEGDSFKWLHADSCAFDETVQQINSLQSDAVQELVPTGPNFAPWSASDHFGLPLHPAQDIYSHSNWVELGFPVADDPATVDLVEGEEMSDLVDLATKNGLGPWTAPPSLGVVRDNILLDDLVVGIDPLVPDARGILHVHDKNGNHTADEGDAVLSDFDPDWQVGLLPHPTLPGQAGFVPGIFVGEGATFQYLDTPGPFKVPILTTPPTYRLLMSGVGGRPIQHGDVFGNQCDPLRRGPDGKVIEPHEVNPCPPTFETFFFNDDYSCMAHFGSRFALTHSGTARSELNKDTEDAAPTRFPKARALAVLQSKYEWCRFVQQAGREGADGVLLALWVKENANPHPSVTPCSRDDGTGPMGVTVSINGVETLNDKDDDAEEPGELNLSLVLYDSPATFSRSDKSKSGPVDVDDDGSSAPSRVPATELPAPVSMCVSAGDPTFRVALHGWDDDDPDGDNAGDFNQNGDPDTANVDDAVIGFSDKHLPPAIGAPSVYFKTSDDLRIAYSVTRVPDTDGDGLDACGEPFYGTEAANSDTDVDGLLDGIEVDGSNPTDPLVADADGDGLKDGEEDTNANGSLDAGETNPNDPDSDDDLLSDGVEVGGANPTDPLAADSDGDGLKDGQEDANTNGSLDAGETNPNDPDSDHDGLTDGQEVEFGINPLDPDSDDDGLPDGRDVDWIAAAIRALPANVIKSPAAGNRNAMLNLLADAQALLRKGNRSAALDKLATLRRRLDGCGTSPDGNDWIVDCAAQIKIRALVDLLRGNL
jgi:hypothetical protein